MFRLLNLIASILLFTGLGLACVSWAGGPRLRDIREVACFLLEQYQRTEMLQRHRQVTLQCFEGKKRVIEGVLAGHLGLREAAAEFRNLHAPLEDGYDPISGINAESTNEKYLCGNVLAWVRDRVEHSPELAPALLDRLEKEYQEYFQEEPGPAYMLLER